MPVAGVVAGRHAGRAVRRGHIPRPFRAAVTIGSISAVQLRVRLQGDGRRCRHGMNVQVIADPAGRLIWASPALPGARHDMGAVSEHGILDALHTAGSG
jgi:hypothetical protein